MDQSKQFQTSYFLSVPFSFLPIFTFKFLFFRHIANPFGIVDFVSSLFIFRDVRSRRGEVCKRQEMDIAHGGTEWEPWAFEDSYYREVAVASIIVIVIDDSPFMLSLTDALLLYNLPFPYH